MTFFVLGNGFDLHYGLKTTYYHFKHFLIENGYCELVGKVDQLFDNHFFDPENIRMWSDFEDMLTVFNNLDAEEIYDEAMSNAEDDDDRADYWDSPSWNVGYYNDYIQILKQQFDLWIRSFDTHITPDQYFRPQKGDFVLNFNYTTTVEDNFDPATYDIVHIHGVAGQELVLGHNEYVSPDTFTIIEDEAYDYRDSSTKSAVNNVLERAAIEYFKNCEEIIHDHEDMFRIISHYDKVVIMGLSCGPQDSSYIFEILKYANQIDFYYHSDEAKENFGRCVARHNIIVNYIPW